MTGWYDPPRLASIAIRVAISTVFGEFADRRESWVSTRDIDPKEMDSVFCFDATENGEFWLDYVADTGDGWNPVYAVARLLAEPQLKPDGATSPLPRGRILVMGGDQVYPTASREAYHEKLIAPYDAAARDRIGPDDRPKVFAIPGNHDWYDGLSAFLGLFCRRQRDPAWSVERPGRVIGGRQTVQSRSYFAIKLPNDWWLWGADVQLAGYIDQPQVDFFHHVAAAWMEPGSQLILCTGQPSWSYVEDRHPSADFANFSYLERIVRLAKDRGHSLRLVLSGDSHHYARYIQGGRHYITAGGGGAFLHPTHHLTDKTAIDRGHSRDDDEVEQTRPSRKFRIANKRGTKTKALFPDKKTSLFLSLRNIHFAALNLQYAMTMAALLVVFFWLLHAQASYTGRNLLSAIIPTEKTTFSCAIMDYLSLVFASPWGSLCAAASFGAYTYLADWKGWSRIGAGVAHTLAQIAAVTLSTCLLAFLIAMLPEQWPRNLILVIAAGAVGGAVSATILGLYFLVSLNLFGKHWNEAFSALRIEDYKNFLRLRIDGAGQLTVYAIGLRKVPSDDGRRLRNPALKPHLIETVEVRRGPPAAEPA